ncbi:hypothetical protein [Pseudopelagicola sp. nBUS_19]|uniref:hypothetical protein n=1 Tax=Pseudopelagicola sp. nBUS_19 TaxID=3395316 RepID=UPI003EB7778A
MPDEVIDTLIVWGGQPGLAMSEDLSKRAVLHPVLERAHIAERWHSARWDGLRANSSASIAFMAPRCVAANDRCPPLFTPMARNNCFGLTMVQM